MMLHEAVMLEIYRQALNASELASPRCQSRESTASASGNNDARCPSNESHYSGNDGHTTPAQTPTPTTPPVGLPLPATLAPAAAAALLPPQSAAMAAYFNAAAAAAAQQNHLLLTNPLAAAASLVQQATQQAAHSPNTPQTLTPTPTNCTDLVDASALDFSTKRSRRQSDDDDANGASEDEGDGADDGERNDNDVDNVNDNEAEDLNSPLDLSVNNGRKRQSDEEEPVIISNRKMARSNDYKSLPASSTWVPPINPYLAAVAAANISPKTSLSMDWNTKAKIAPNEATKALEKMTEMTRLGGSSKSDHTEASNRNASSSSSSLSTTTSTTSNGRHSAWQSHWLNKGADAVKDVFKCVWCKQSFATLASLTTHMKETQHCGVNVPPSVTANSGTSSNSGGNQTTQSSHHARHSTTQSNATASAQIAANNAATSGGSKSDLNMLIKETMPLPRKLVRGQDVWLGKGAEQTRQILKCMWCGQSFRSLAEMTSHMQETQHYTNIISQEQIISWKSSDEKTSRDNSSSSSSGNRGLPANTAAITTSNTAPEHCDGNNSVSPNSHAANANSTVSAVLTCKVCDQAFTTLKELSNHMVKNNHYKEHMIRTATVTENVPTMIRGRGRQTREKRKKSLPVRKLLEMERAQHDFKSAGLDQALKPLRDFAVSTKLACETCGDKVETAMFVDHIRQCIDRSLILSPRSQHNNNNNNNNNNNTIKTPYGPSTPQERLNSPQTPHSRSDGRKTSDGNISPLSATTTRTDILCPLPPDADKTTSSTSVLSALEQLIEKSFDSRPRHSSTYGDGSSAGTPLGSSILKRLGIDDNIDYTKPLMDQQTMQFLRSYSNYPSNRDRSASESSSVSERCSSRLESFTPDRCHDLSRQPTPRLTPDKNVQVLKETREPMYGTKIKSEPIDCSDQQIPDNDNTAIHEMPKKISVKKEFNIPEEQEDFEHNKMKETNDMRHCSLTPSSRAISPSISERSLTPKSTCSTGEKKSSTLGLTESSSLNALSSMFNNLNNMANTTMSSSANIETNNNHTAPMMPKKMNANPLAALQKLCETTDTPAANTRSSSANHNVLTHSNTAVSTSSNVSGGGSGGNSNASMLAFSWACNDAVVTADSIIKCSFCDTPFSSKGAYRHHLSKVHFVKDDHGHEMNNMKSPASLAAISPKSLTSPKSATSSKSPAVQQQRLEATPPSSVATTPTINPYDESPQSKFLKYTELAKQLSSKNA